MNKNNTILDKCMERDAAAILYENAIAGISITLLTSTLMVFGFTYPNIDTFRLTWWFAMTSLLVIRAANVVWWKTKVKHTEYDGKKALKYFVVGANLTAIMWSIYLVVSVVQSSVLELVTIIIAVGSMAGGSAAVLTGHKFTAMFFPFALLFPGSIALLLSEDRTLQILGVLGLAFTLVIVIVAKKAAEFTKHTLFLKNENASLIQDMEEKVKDRTRKIYELSNIDPLTGLYNRAAFLFELDRQTSIPNNTFALLFIDLDGFKKINDTIGHKAGDEILRETAARLKAFMPNKSLLCRWGGDEFLVVFENTSEASAVEKAKQLITLLSTSHQTKNSELSVGATIGIAMYPEHAHSENRLIQLADMAMYSQKKNMRSTVAVFSERMESSYSYELRLKDGLMSALHNNELRLVYQPIILSDNAQVFAFEALLRWQFEGEEIDTKKFIAIAEQFGLIHDIGAWVLKTACEQAKIWNISDNIAVCVNASILQLQETDFIHIVKSSLDSSGLPPNLLHIEITESAFALDLNVIPDKIKQLQLMGIKVSMDDFGSCHSSLTVMQDLAINIVKIDCSFIKKLDSNGDSILSAILNIAESLDFMVVAEGVETEEQAQVLLNLGVHYLQGYNYSKPIEVENIQSYLNGNRHTH